MRTLVSNRRYWQVELGNGKIINEGEMEWRDVPKKSIERLTLHYDGRQWSLFGKEAYFIKYRASEVPGIPESFRLERRTIGFYEGSNKVCYHVNELTGKFEIEVIDTNV